VRDNEERNGSVSTNIMVASISILNMAEASIYAMREELSSIMKANI